MLSLTPKLVFITGDWVWRDPFYRTVVRHAEYYPAGDGMEANLPRLRDLMARGYSVCIFPEGTRSLNHEIQRFHKGAFTIARELSADILPILIRGAGYISPKGDLIFRSGTITMTFADRCRPYEEIDAESDIECDRLVAKQMRQYYRDWSSKITMD